MSALIDIHTVTVTYDWKRGNRGGGSKRAASSGMRNASSGLQPASSGMQSPSSGMQWRRPGTHSCWRRLHRLWTMRDRLPYRYRHPQRHSELECINCTACMDACDDVMLRVKRPVGLIRLTSDNAVRTGRSSWITTRVKAYAAVWLVLVGATATLFASRRDLDVSILRQPGTLYTAFNGEPVANLYNVQVINRTARARVLEFRVLTPERHRDAARVHASCRATRSYGRPIAG